MKTRTDFVSNSSSSSFIVICDAGADVEATTSFNGKTWLNFPSENGCHEFGWENTIYSDIYDKLNFIGIQILDLYTLERNSEIAKNASTEYRSYLPMQWMGKAKQLEDMTIKVLKEKFGINAQLNDDLLRYQLKTGYIQLSHEYYIDHQSSVVEGENMDMFKDEETLYKFLAYDESYIQGGNDNG